MKTKRLFALVLLIGLALAVAVGPSLGRRARSQGRVAPLEAAAPASIQSATLTWQLETVDSDDDVGTYTSLALDSNDQPHISYYDETHGDLKYAAFDGATWQIETVDSAGDVGQYTSLALDSNDRPHISYYDATHGRLEYATYDGSDWLTKTVDSAADVGQYTSLALDSNDRPRISYYDVTNDDLKYAAYDGADWEPEKVDSAVNAGMFTSLALDSGDRPHISYISYSSPQSVKYAQHDGDDWLLETVFESPSGGPVRFTSLSLDLADVPHLSWYLGSPPHLVVHTLMYATYDGAWQPEPVDSVGLVGQYPSLALDPAGRPHISYSGGNSLKCAYLFDAFWYIDTADDAGTVGSHTSLALDSAGQPHISYYDETHGHLKHASDVPLRFQRLAAQLVEDMRGTDMAPGWDMAQLGSEVRPLYRPDVAGIAYYDFPVVDLSGAQPQSVGFVIVSTGDHDFPIPEWDFTGESPTQELMQEAEGSGESAAQFYKLDVLIYAAEDEQDALVAVLGELPPRLSGVDPAWLDDPPPPFQVIWTPNVQAEDDTNASEISGTLFISGTLTPPGSLAWSGWEWDELKADYGASFAIPLEWLHREAGAAWGVESQLREGSEGLQKGETRTLAMLWSNPEVTLTGEGAKHVQAVLVSREGLPPKLEVTALESFLGQELPLTVIVQYPNGVRETFSFLIVEPCMVWLPLVTSGFGGGPVPLSAQGTEGRVRPQGGGCFHWTSWSRSWAGDDSDQRWYQQVSCDDPVNSSNFWSGCGATAWAMLFGWADYQASVGNPYWDGRWGLYRQDGGTGADAVAPDTMTDGVKNMTWEIRNDIDTWCVYIWAEGCWQGATDPGDMSDASDYLDGRSHTRLFACGNTLWPSKTCRNRASDAIKRGGGQDTPAVIGISLSGGPHYALAYGYKQRKLKGCLGETWWTSREFYVNQGWGGGRGWVNAYFVWFAGEIRPYAPPQTNLVDDVALYRTSDHRWYYDYGHNGDTNAVGGAWGVQAGDLPLAGDFDRDGFIDDVAIFRTADGTWYYDYDHSGHTNEQSGPWGQVGDLPLAGDFDRDGYVDDIAIFDTSFQIWCYDYDHNNAAHTCDEWGDPWGQVGDLPLAGDFDRDGFVDDVAVFRPATHVAYYDYDHDGTTDQEATHFTTENGLPVAGDFDGDGFVDDVVFFLPDWEPTSIWFYDHDHNGSANDVSEWGWEDGLPLAGSFGGDQDP